MFEDVLAYLFSNFILAVQCICSPLSNFIQSHQAVMRWVLLIMVQQKIYTELEQASLTDTTYMHHFVCGIETKFTM